MSIQDRVEEWTRKMCYPGEIPSSLHKICNPSTALIWEQIITNIKPKQEVAHIRKNIIVSRLRKKSLEDQGEFEYPIPQIEVYREKVRLEKRIRQLEDAAEDKEGLIDNLLHKNKRIYVAIDHTEAQIKEYEEKQFLLKKKCKLLEEDMQRAQEVITLSPVGLAGDSSDNEITKTLQSCVEKLQKITKKAAPRPKLKISQTPRLTISKYQSARKARRDSDKENVFLDEAAGSKSFGPCASKTKRESLGLLPDDILNVSDEFDEIFLGSATKSSCNRSLFACPDAIVKNNDIVETLCNNRDVNETLKNLLRQRNRQLVLKNWQILFDSLFDNINNPYVECGNGKTIDQRDLTELYFIHVKSELQKEKSRIVLKKLRESTKKRKEEIYCFLNSKATSDEERKVFELQIEEARILGANRFLSKEMEKLKKIEITNELQIVLSKIKDCKEEINNYVNRIESLTENLHKVIKQIKNSQEETFLHIKRLCLCVLDSSIETVQDEVNLNEIETFKKFPLEFNRKLITKESKLACQNICRTSLPPYVDLGPSHLDAITTLVDIPFASAEDVIVKMLQSKIKLKVLKSLEGGPKLNDMDCSKYCPRKLERKEEYVESLVTKFMSLINSSSAKQVLAAPEYMQEVQDLTKEMPWTNFISDKRLINGHDYKFYEKVLDGLCKKC